jgi:rare lipoprotein A
MAFRKIAVGLTLLSIFFLALRSRAGTTSETAATPFPCLSCYGQAPAYFKLKKEASEIKTKSSCETYEGEASYYGKNDGFSGKKTANQEKFNPRALTAAHMTFPFNSIVTVENLKTGKKVKVRINDRGPYVEGRIIDLSYAAARKIGLDGVGEVRIRACFDHQPDS